ncbi:MAG: hypothetical protein KC609_22940 [Myxococcales bacterium]|nr:hypothetical protein [Myxococcales bacterium]
MRTDRLIVAVLTLGLIVGSATFASAAPKPQGPPSDDAFLKKVESDLGKKDPTLRKPKSMLSELLPEIAVSVGVSAAYYRDTKSIYTTGADDPSQNGFTLNYLELTLYKNIDPYFRASVVLNFGFESIETEEAYVETLGVPGGLKFRAGFFKTGFGRINARHTHTWDFIDRPVVNGKFFGVEGHRLLGAEASWLAPLPWYLLVGASVGMPDGEESNRSFFGGEKKLDKWKQVVVVAYVKQFFTLGPNWSLNLGFSGAFGPNPTADGKHSFIYGGDLYIKYRPVTSGSYFQASLLAEWMIRQRQTTMKTLTDSGGFVELALQLAKRWRVALRAEHVDNLENDYLDPDQHGARQRYSVSLAFVPSEFSRIRLQGNLDHNRFAPSTLSGAIFATLEVTFGSHPPHPY